MRDERFLSADGVSDKHPNIRNGWAWIFQLATTTKEIPTCFKSISDTNPDSGNRSPICEAPRRSLGTSPRIYGAWKSFGGMSSCQKHTRPETRRTRSSLLDTLPATIAFSETLIRFCSATSNTSSEDNERSMNAMIALGILSALSTRRI